LLESTPEQARRYVQAGVAQSRHWDDHAARYVARYAGCHTVSAVSALLRRSLPLDKEDLIRLLNWCVALRELKPPFAPVTKALQRYAASHEVDSRLLDAIREFTARLRTSYQKEAKRLRTIV